MKRNFVLLFLLSMSLFGTQPVYAGNLDLNNVHARLSMVCSGVNADKATFEVSVYLNLFNPTVDAILGYNTNIKVADTNGGTKTYLHSVLKGAKYTMTPPADQMDEKTENVRMVVTALDESDTTKADRLVIDVSAKTQVAIATWEQPVNNVGPTPVNCTPVELPTPVSP